jgi:hypothetical protein
MKEHHLKTWPEYFQAVHDGSKSFELREEDGRIFDVGDILYLEEWDAMNRYSGRVVKRRVTYLLRGPKFGLLEGHVIMSLEAM